MQYDVTYDRALLKRTLNLYLRQRILEGMGTTGMAAVVLVAGVLAWLLISGDRSIFTGILTGAFPLLFVAVIVIYRGWHRLLDQQLAAMGEPVAKISLDDHQITVATGAGSATVPWARFSEIREFPGCWLLVIEANQFVSLPLEGMDQEGLDFVRARIALRAP